MINDNLVTAYVFLYFIHVILLEWTKEKDTDMTLGMLIFVLPVLWPIVWWPTYKRIRDGKKRNNTKTQEPC